MHTQTSGLLLRSLLFTILRWSKRVVVQFVSLGVSSEQGVNCEVVGHSVLEHHRCIGSLSISTDDFIWFVDCDPPFHLQIKNLNIAISFVKCNTIYNNKYEVTFWINPDPWNNVDTILHSAKKSTLRKIIYLN